MIADHPQWHFLDVAEVQPVFYGEPGQINHFIVIAAFQDDRIQLDALKAGSLGGANAA